MNKHIIHNNFLTVRDKKKCLKQNVLRIMQRTYSKIFSLIGALFLSSALKGVRYRLWAALRIIEAGVDLALLKGC
jgi:hypothetical protein